MAKTRKKTAKPGPLSEVRERGTRIAWEAFFPTQAEALRIPRDETVWQWADANRILSGGAADGLPYSSELTPYCRGPCEAATDGEVETIILKWPTQVGKTETLLNVCGFHIDRDPCPMLIVFPTEQDGLEEMEERIRPMLEDTPAIASALSGRKTDLKKRGARVGLSRLTIAWSNSASRLARRAIRLLVLDEVNKYPARVSGESAPIKLAMERTKTFRTNRKIVICSTPTTEDGAITREEATATVHRYHVPCPKCRKLIQLTWPQVKFGEAKREDGKWDARRAAELARYECQECGATITDQDKPGMLAKGRWRRVGEDRGRRRISFQLNALYSPWVDFGDMAREWIESKDDIESLQNFINSWLAEEWHGRGEPLHGDLILSRRGGYPRGTVAEKALLLTAGVDVQKRELWYIIRAWAANLENWLVREGTIPRHGDEEEDVGWELLTQLIAEAYAKPSGQELAVRRACVDCGYDTHEESGVYRFVLRAGEPFRAVRGWDRRVLHYRESLVEADPRTGKPYGGGIRRIDIDVNYFKDQVFEGFWRAEGEPWAWWAHNEIGADYARHMTSEYRQTVMVKRPHSTTRIPLEMWTQRKGEPNHWWDCEIYAAAAVWPYMTALLKAGEAKRAPRGSTRPPAQPGRQLRGRQLSEKRRL